VGIVDTLDREIISVVLADGRATYAKIGGRVGLSVAATKRRLDRLVSTGVIRGFTATVDPVVLGWEIEAYVQTYTSGIVPFEQMRRGLEPIAEIVEAATVAGTADALLHVVASDMSHLERAISRIRAVDRIERTDATLVLTRLISRPMI
jgi:DNA-binding Lrp family transcriptional regulator